MVFKSEVFKDEVFKDEVFKDEVFKYEVFKDEVFGYFLGTVKKTSGPQTVGAGLFTKSQKLLNNFFQFEQG